MADAGHPAITATVDKTNHVLKQIEAAYGWPKERRNQSYAALRAVLHALRDRLPVDEAAHLGAQLPMLVRGLYYEGWTPAKVPVKMSRAEFLDRVRSGFGYDVKGGVEGLTSTVLAAVKQHVSDGEWEDIRSALPEDLAALLP